MIKEAVKTRLTMGFEGLSQNVAACQVCGKYCFFDDPEILINISCPQCGHISYQCADGKTIQAENETIEFDANFIHKKANDLFIEVNEIFKEMPAAADISQNREKAIYVNCKVETWLWRNKDAIIFYNFFDILRNGGAKEIADVLENLANFNYK